MSSGDLLLVRAANRQDTGFATPSGYTLLFADTAGRNALFGKIAGGSESAPNVSSGSAGATQFGATIGRFSGAPASIAGIVHATAETTWNSSADISTPARTVTVDNILEIYLGLKHSDVGPTVDAPNSSTLINEGRTSGLAYGSNFWAPWAWRAQTTAEHISASAFDTASTSTQTHFGGVVTLVGLGIDPVTVTDVDTDETITTTQEDVVVTGTNFKASQSTGKVEILQGENTVEQTIVAWADDEITFDVDQGSLTTGAATLRVTNSEGTSGDLGITLTDPGGIVSVTLTSLHSPASGRITAEGELMAGDILEARGVGGGAAPAGLTLNPDGTFQFADGSTPTSFECRCYDSGLTSYGAWAVQAIA